MLSAASHGETTVRGCCSAPLLLWPPAGKPIQKSRVNGGLKKVDPPPNIQGAQTHVKKCFNKTGFTDARWSRRFRHGCNSRNLPEGLCPSTDLRLGYFMFANIGRHPSLPLTRFGSAAARRRMNGLCGRADGRTDGRTTRLAKSDCKHS